MNFWHSFVPDMYESCDKSCEKCEDPVSAGCRVRPAYLLVVVVLLLITIKF